MSRYWYGNTRRGPFTRKSPGPCLDMLGSHKWIATQDNVWECSDCGRCRSVRFGYYIDIEEGVRA